LCHLRTVLLIRFGESDRPGDLDEAVTLSKRVTALGIPGSSDWVDIVDQGAALHRAVDYPMLATEHLLWVLFRRPYRLAQELIRGSLSDTDAQVSLDRLVGLEAPLDSAGGPQIDFRTLRCSMNVRPALASAAASAGSRPALGEREVLAGLLSRPRSVAARWLTETCSLPAEQLRDLVLESAQRPAESLAERVRRARQGARYELRLLSAADRVELGAQLEVYAQLNPAATAEGEGHLLDLTTGEAELTILLQAPGFMIEGEDAAVLSLDTRDGGQPGMRSASFRLTAMKPGRTTVTAVMFRGSAFEGVLEQAVTVSEDQADIRIERRIPVRPRPVPASDLTLRITTEWQPAQSACVLAYRLASLHPAHGLLGGAEFRSQPLPAGWLHRVRGMLAATLAETIDTAADDTRLRLASFGQYLAELTMPAELRGEMARLGEARTLQLVADEDAWAPWELVYDGTAFLGDRFVIGRWPSELEAVRPCEIPLGPVSIAYYQGIDHADRWAAFVQPSTAPAASLLPGGVLRDLEAEPSLRGLHLVRMTQPEDPGRRDAPAIAVDDQGDDLTRALLTVRRERPLVTIGYVRGADAALAALEQTWAMSFLRARCSALAGPLWAVDQAVDAAFLAQFYERLWAGSSLGSAFRAAQNLARAVRPGSLDWLAYVLFGDPMSRPYRPIKGSGYAVVERVGTDLETPLRPGQAARFRASLRRAPPVWHEDRVLEVVSELDFSTLELHVLTFGLDVSPPSPLPLTKTPDGDYLGWFTLTAPPAPARDSSPVQVHFVHGEQAVHSLTFPVIITRLDGEPS
jgi:hypothetical protein